MWQRAGQEFLFSRSGTKDSRISTDAPTVNTKPRQARHALAPYMHACPRRSARHSRDDAKRIEVYSVGLESRDLNLKLFDGGLALLPEVGMLLEALEHARFEERHRLELRFRTDNPRNGLPDQTRRLLVHPSPS